MEAVVEAGTQQTVGVSGSQTHQRTGTIQVQHFDGAVMGGRCYLNWTTRRRRQKHTAGGGLEMTSILHNFTAGLTQWSHRGFTALASEAIAAGHQVVSVWRNIARPRSDAFSYLGEAEPRTRTPCERQAWARSGGDTSSG
ncbi:hypothetical protein EYF80_026550 [Liparis tanakae]|uniref:Uncharacterized protein n=1 Tax=Liparis tanakae TaxID=230148 RepID=A0A4Z2HBD7_9TELE|nr:hypothetical protein EYF80_026550 [Liparis tanakae]